MQEIVSVYVLRDRDIIRAISTVASVPEFAFNIFAYILHIEKYFRYIFNLSSITYKKGLYLLFIVVAFSNLDSSSRVKLFTAHNDKKCYCNH